MIDSAELRHAEQLLGRALRETEQLRDQVKGLERELDDTRRACDALRKQGREQEAKFVETLRERAAESKAAREQDLAAVTREALVAVLEGEPATPKLREEDVVWRHGVGARGV